MSAYYNPYDNLCNGIGTSEIQLLSRNSSSIIYIRVIVTAIVLYAFIIIIYWITQKQRCFRD